MIKFTKIIYYKKYFQKFVEIILKGTLCVPITNFYFGKMLSVFKIFVNKVVWKLLHIWYLMILGKGCDIKCHRDSF